MRSKHMSHIPREEIEAAPEAEQEHEHGPDCAHDHAAPFVRATPKVGRNEPCPCGSGKKHKKCCG